jgi:D-erythronate 2-dehydrogenase
MLGAVSLAHPLTPILQAIAELYLNDYSRRGYVDGRTLRLPTVAIRAGAPSSAASSFISGIIREPLQGELTSLCMQIQL